MCGMCLARTRMSAGKTTCCGHHLVYLVPDGFKSHRVPPIPRDIPMPRYAALIESLCDRLIARGVVDLDPYILHHLGKGPDPDRKRRPRPYFNPWNTVE